MNKIILIILWVPMIALALGGSGGMGLGASIGSGGLAGGDHTTMPSDGSESARAYTEGVNTNPDFQPTNAEVNQHFDGNSQQIGAYRQGQTVSNEVVNEP